MLVTDYTLEIFKSKCQPYAKGVHCYAHLCKDVSDVIPLLNAELGGFEYIKDPPSVTFRAHGKLITVHARKLAINALKDKEEAEKIVQWLIREINETWERRDNIAPSYESLPRPQIIDILKLLPKTNCQKCGEPTCMVFAARVVEGGKTQEDCPFLDDQNKRSIASYMLQFKSA